MIPNQQNFTRHDDRFNFSTMFSGCQIGQVHVTFKSEQSLWHSFSTQIDSSSWSSFHTESYILNISSSFHRTFGICLQELGGFKAEIAVIYTALAGACSKFQLDFDSYNANFDWFMCCQMRVFIG